MQPARDDWAGQRRACVTTMSSAREQPPPPPNYPPPPSRGGSGGAARFAPRRVYAVPSGTGALPDAAIEAALEEEDEQQPLQHGAIDDVVVHVAPSPHAPPPPLPPMPPPHPRPKPPVTAAAAAAAVSSPGGDEGVAATGAGAAAPQGARLQSRPHPQAELKHDARSTGGGDRDGADGDDDGDNDGALSEAGENAPAPSSSAAAAAAAAAGAAPRETYHDDADLNAPRHAVDDAELLDATQAHRLALRATRHRDIRLSDAELSVLQFLSDSIRRRASSDGGAFSMPLPRGVHISENVLAVLYARGYMPGTDRRSGEPTLMW